MKYDFIIQKKKVDPAEQWKNNIINNTTAYLHTYLRS
jgi:hypothetical protein